jgi:hexokinase
LFPFFSTDPGHNRNIASDRAAHLRQWCEKPQLASLLEPAFCVADNMASSPVLSEARRVAAEFDFPAAQLNKAVQFFREQMKDGLEKEGSTLSQIPSFVTTVPDGSEKVRLGNLKHLTCVSAG